MNVIKVGALAASLAASVQSNAQISTYHIGNSLTWDSQPHLLWQANGGNQADWISDYHIKCGSSLPNILQNPFVTCNGGFYETDIIGTQFDVVTVQTHPDSAPFQSHIDAYNTMFDFIQANQNDAQLVIYFGWPKLSDWETDWEAPHSDNNYRYRRDTQSELATRIITSRSETIRVAPAGAVFAQIRREIMQEGNPALPSSFNDFYRDNIHASDIGRVAANLTVASVTSGDAPFRFAPIRSIPNSLHEELQRIVYDVLTQDPNTGIAPCAGRIASTPEVDIEDLLTVLRNFGTQNALLSQGDVTGADEVDIEDLLVVLREFGQSCD